MNNDGNDEVHGAHRFKDAVHENVKHCKMPEKHSLDSLDEIKEQRVREIASCGTPAG